MHKFEQKLNRILNLFEWAIDGIDRNGHPIKFKVYYNPSPQQIANIIGTSNNSSVGLLYDSSTDEIVAWNRLYATHDSVKIELGLRLQNDIGCYYIRNDGEITKSVTSPIPIHKIKNHKSIKAWVKSRRQLMKDIDKERGDEPYEV